MKQDRFDSVEDLIARTGLRRDELATLAEIGALNSFGYDRRTALWQIERAVRPTGELFQETGDRRQETGEERRTKNAERRTRNEERGTRNEERGTSNAPRAPLPPMTPLERVTADYAGTGVTVGPHPMSFKRRELAMRGVMPAIDLSRGRPGRRVRVAGAVITRQRPGTAKGFVFLTLEDETGIANIIVQPQTFAEQRMTILEQPFLLVEGRLQIQDRVTSVKAERCESLWTAGPEVESHDFH